MNHIVNFLLECQRVSICDFPRSNIVKKKLLEKEVSPVYKHLPRRKKQVKQKNRALCANSSVSVFASSPLVKLSISLSQFVQRFAGKYFQVKIVIIFYVGHG